MAVCPADVEEAADRIRGHVRRTPVATCAALDAAAGARVFLKCEQLQRVGAFKLRGATNAVLGLEEADAARGVACHSSGNHAQALALAARTRGILAHVVMPEGASVVKRAAVEGYGARVVTCPPTLAARAATLAEVLADTGAVEVHPYDDDRVIAGQGTATLELLEDTGPLDVILVPVGGGGLLSGTALAAAGRGTGTQVVGVEPAGADDAARSFRTGTLQPSVNPDTVADGLRASLSARTFAVICEHVSDIVTVDDAAIVAAMRFVWERAKLVIEPSAAVPVAALLTGRVEGDRVGVVLSGGNVDLDRLPWLSPD